MSDDDDDEQIMRPALPLRGDVDASIDLSKPPATGEEYLRRVRYPSLGSACWLTLSVHRMEAKRCEQVVVAKRSRADEGEANGMRKKTILETRACPPAPEGLAPSDEWETRFIAQFADLRLKFELASSRRASLPAPFKLPPVQDEAAWKALIYTARTAPSMALISHVNQMTTIKLIACFAKWIDARTPSADAIGLGEAEARWAFSLVFLFCFFGEKRKVILFIVY